MFPRLSSTLWFKVRNDHKETLHEIWKAKLKQCPFFYKGHCVQISWKAQRWAPAILCSAFRLSSQLLVLLTNNGLVTPPLGCEATEVLAAQSPSSWASPFLGRWTYFFFHYLFKGPYCHLSVLLVESLVALTQTFRLPLPLLHKHFHFPALPLSYKV